MKTPQENKRGNNRKKKEKKKGKTTTVYRKGVRNHYEKKKLTQRETHTPPATPPARRDLQMLRNSRVGGFTPSSAAIAEAVRDRFCTWKKEGWEKLRKVEGVTEYKAKRKIFLLADFPFEKLELYMRASPHNVWSWSEIIFVFGDSFVKQRTTAWSRLRDESISHLVRISYYSLRHVLFLKSLRNLTCSFNYLNQNLFFTLKTDKHIHQVRMHYKWFMSLFHVTCKQCLFSCFDFETVLYI